MKFKHINLIVFFIFGTGVFGQDIKHNPDSNHGNKFEQLGTILPTPNVYRTASGAPGHKYWQQKADYHIKAELDEANFSVKANETITYQNNSPDDLDYLWMQLDGNNKSSINNANYQYSSSLPKSISKDQLNTTKIPNEDNGEGFIIEKIVDKNGKNIPYFINKTMMRVDLPKTLKSKESITFSVYWHNNIPDRMKGGGRSGYEVLDGHALFTMTQWYPRMCVYSDYKGWQNNQFTGRGEFALTFGDFTVEMTVPSDHMVAGTGECQNYNQMLTSEQLARYKKAQSSKEPVEIVTLEEAKKAEKSISKKMKTWIFKAENVRDFAWTSSRKYCWDAMNVTIPENNKNVMAMSFYPKESYHLYRKFSTKAVAHTILTYSEFTIPYPYPVAQSVEASNGMEYPMICFNYGRTEEDGTYSESTKYGMLGVIIHEVGHNFFPMIINSDERQWSWMDEGLNTFVEYLTEERWDSKFPSRRGPAHTIVNYMKLPKEQLEPIMTNSENIIHFGPNAYSKPATGLNILRETIMGRDLFDKAFKTYAKRWAFRHPEPADFFRTMNDASAENLDWFWRGWFYGIEPVDIAIDKVTVASPDFDIETKPYKYTYTVDEPSSKDQFEDISKKRNKADKNIKYYTDEDKSTRDFYWRYNRGLEKVNTKKEYKQTYDGYEKLSKKEQKELKDINGYEINFKNVGGLVMPIILEFTFEDGTILNEKIPAQIWRKNEKEVSKTFYFDKKLKSIQLDPMKETADIDTTNNYWSADHEEQTTTSRFKVFKSKMKKQARGSSNSKVNPMQAAK